MPPTQNCGLRSYLYRKKKNVNMSRFTLILPDGKGKSRLSMDCQAILSDLFEMNLSWS